MKRRPVPSLRACALRTIPRLVKENIVRTAHGTQASWYRVFTGEQHHAGRRVAYIEIIRINREGKAK